MDNIKNLPAVPWEDADGNPPETKSVSLAELEEVKKMALDYTKPIGELKGLSENAVSALVFFGAGVSIDPHETYMYFSSPRKPQIPEDLRKLAKGLTEIATWLEMRKAGAKNESTG